MGAFEHILLFLSISHPSGEQWRLVSFMSSVCLTLGTFVCGVVVRLRENIVAAGTGFISQTMQTFVLFVNLTESVPKTNAKLHPDLCAVTFYSFGFDIVCGWFLG